ncbi:hypothetical protein FQN57_000512 [Myotisia sp. PD_48]|nr:hypothetical protein FQN57_000512 [Myotisia sp. PD_48]
MHWNFLTFVAGLGTFAPSVFASGWTEIHEEGRCAIRGHCGKKSFFGAELPCPDNELAEIPEKATRQKLVDLCGKKWESGSIDALASNLHLAEGIIASCPACKENFFNLFCTFTCSPDQSLFLNVTQAEEVKGKLLVTELDNLWSETYQSGFYDSCKNVKNGASGGKAMDFIGGGAKNYTQFLKFLGDKKFLGSPFQINFITHPRDSNDASMRPVSDKTKSCADDDPTYRCSCVDCPAVCPELPAISEERQCRVGHLPCFSLAVILIYSISLLFLVLFVAGHIAFRRHQERKIERVRLLQDAEPSDDDDEGDVLEDTRISKQYPLNQFLGKMFKELGRACARFPGMTISLSTALIILLSLGWTQFAVETDPVRLWVSPNSAAAKEKEYFDSSFGPFYRVEQVFVLNDTNPDGPPGPVLNYENLAWWFDVESRVRRIISLEKNVTLDRVCFKPTDGACAVQSISAYFGGSFANVDPNTWKDQLKHCALSPGARECLPDFQQPISPELILGGFEGPEDVLEARALIVTWVVNNHPPGSNEEAQAMDWESTIETVLKIAQEEAEERGLRLSFNTERSLEQELNKSTNTDARIVVISYVIMFIYASLALGSTTISWRSMINNPANALVQSKFSLGMVGILIVLMSVSASVGIFSFVGVKVTLIIAEVIPFLVLAVGVDNIFLIVHEFERVNASHPDEEIDDRIARALGRIGPSILLSATTETIAFALGVFVGMPAVKNFAAYAAAAVLINALLQVTMFISLLALNQKRVENLRIDCLPCITVRKATSNTGPGSQPIDQEDGLLQQFIKKIYATRLLKRGSKIAVIVSFFGIFTAGLALIPMISLGLDQRIAIPSDSYLVPYFNDLYDYFGVGPPVYFVTRDVNVTARSHQQQLCGRFSTCDEFSMNFILEQEYKRPNVSYISGSTASWIDDFFYWLNPQQDCCKEDGKSCFDGRDPPWSITLYGMPEGAEFVRYAEKWLASNTTESCPLGGKAPYRNALVIDQKHIMTNASHFRTAHTPLRSQSDFINAYAAARRIANDISARHKIDVFPYSKFYIFFDQYATIGQLTGALLGSAVAVIFVVTSVLLGSLITGGLVTLTVIMTLVDIMGTMVVAGVSLNAVSLVNLVICVGISVEFCAHIARAFMFPSASLLEKAPERFRHRTARAWAALVNVGGSVFSGITLTKLVGICVLAFTRSKIFEIYYFRIWLALILFAATHALIFLPVVLSIAGGDGETYFIPKSKVMSLDEKLTELFIGYADPHSDGGLEQDLAARGYRSLLLDDDYYDSDDEEL